MQTASTRRIRRIAVCFVVCALACNDPAEPIFSSGVVFGHIASTTGVIVPGATATVELFPDTVRSQFGVLECGGSPTSLITGVQQLDSAGNYSMQLSLHGTPRVCVELTGDPHGLYSDIGLKRSYVGWLDMRPIGSGARDSLHANLKYTETP